MLFSFKKGCIKYVFACNDETVDNWPYDVKQKDSFLKELIS